MAQLTLSSRLPACLTPSPLHQALQNEAGPPPADLTQSNPTVAGFDYPTLSLPLLGPETWAYAPEPLGSLVARTELSQYFADSGVLIDAEHIVLTASTSEAYSTLFKVLTDPGSYVATATPGYPLVPHLAELDGVELTYFRWRTQDEAPGLDWPSVVAALERRPKALVLVQPSTPLGQSLTPADLERLSRMCTDAGTVLVIDAVFEAYTAQNGPAPLPHRLRTHGATIVLGGLSKAGGLPQLKLGWMLVLGDPSWTALLLQGLEWVGDAYLSVATPIQVALPHLLPHLAPMQRQIKARIDINVRALARAFENVSDVRVRPYVGGWSAVLEGPSVADEDEVVRLLRREANVLVHPGYFYDFDEAGYWVLSLIVPVTTFAAALPKMTAVFAASPWSCTKGHP